MNSARSATLHKVSDNSSKTSTIFLLRLGLIASFISLSVSLKHLSLSRWKPLYELSSGIPKRP